MRFPSPPEKYSAGYLQQLDGRTGVAQVMRARYDALTSDLGGASRLSYQQRAYFGAFRPPISGLYDR